jgi:hypothetical protein
MAEFVNELRIIEAWLDVAKPDAGTLSGVFIRLIEKCGCDDHMLSLDAPNECLHNPSSHFLPELLKCFLSCGMNPDEAVETVTYHSDVNRESRGNKYLLYTLISGWRYLADTGVHCVQLLLEAGADPNLAYDDEHFKNPRRGLPDTIAIPAFCIYLIRKADRKLQATRPRRATGHSHRLTGYQRCR